ncbi:MAG: hypothetical protein ABIS68_10405 [Casimicrobiaceae bacterium]
MLPSLGQRTAGRQRTTGSRTERNGAFFALLRADSLKHCAKEMIMNKFHLTAISAAFCMALGSGSAMAALGKSPEYKAAKDQITAKYTEDKAACKAMTGNAKDICMEEAKGHENVAKAELTAKSDPSAKHSYDVRLAKAKAIYDVAKEKCDDQSGNAKDVCRKEAKAAYVAGKADAKVAEKTADAKATMNEKSTAATMKAREKVADAKRSAADDKRDAAYAAAKEKCDTLSGDAKSNCIKTAKARYGQS